MTHKQCIRELLEIDLMRSAIVLPLLDQQGRIFETKPKGDEAALSFLQSSLDFSNDFQALYEDYYNSVADICETLR